MEQNLFGQILLNFSLITEEQLNKAVELQAKLHPPKMLGELLVEQGYIDQRTLQSILSVQSRKLNLKKAKEDVRTEELRTRLKQAGATEYLRVAKELGASDLYLMSALPPMIRLNGSLIELPVKKMTFEDSRTLIFSLLSKEQVSEYYTRKYLDFCMDLPGLGRFRTNVFRHFRGISAIFRVIADKVWQFERIGVPPVVRKFIDYSRGLVLVTGPTGSGKSTTLASLIDLINREKHLHIITIEDPIEVVFRSDMSFISQREIPTHSATFASALRAALREDPDVIVVGEMRDPETVATAITAAETGHLVFGTLHTQNAYRTILRVLDQFPAQKRAHIRTLLAGVLRAVVSQQLVPSVDGRRRHLAAEVMVVNSAISNLIREDKPWQIPLMMQTGGKLGMRLMDDSLLQLVREKAISVEEAVSRAIDKNKFLNPE